MSTPRLDTWMPLYVADYLKDTRHLSGLEHGAYLLLLMHAWTNEGAIPADDSRLARIACLTPKEWKTAKREVMSFWSPLTDTDGVFAYINKRVEKELVRREAVTEKRRQAGAKGAASRWQDDDKPDGKRIANPSQNDGQLQSQLHPPTEGKRARGASLSDALLDHIWNEAPPRSRQRSGRPQVRKALIAAIGRGHDFEDIRKGLAAYWSSADATKDDGEFAKGVHRMIEGDRWQDWMTSAQARQSDDQPDSLETWKRRLAALHGPERIWIESISGPRPGERGCRVPAELLEGR